MESWQRWSGWTGLTIADCWNVSVISRRWKQKKPTMLHTLAKIWQREQSSKTLQENRGGSIGLLQIEQMLRHHIAVRAPVIGQPEKGAKTNFIYSRTPQTVRGFQPPEEILLLPTQVMKGVSGGVVGFLINQNAVEPQRFQFAVLFLCQRLDFDHQRIKFLANGGKMLTKIIHADFGFMLTSDQQQMFKPQRIQGVTFAADFLFIKRFALNAVTHGESAIGAFIGAQIG